MPGEETNVCRCCCRRGELHTFTRIEFLITAAQTSMQYNLCSKQVHNNNNNKQPKVVALKTQSATECSLPSICHFALYAGFMLRLHLFQPLETWGSLSTVYIRESNLELGDWFRRQARVKLANFAFSPFHLFAFSRFRLHGQSGPFESEIIYTLV